ncbi:MAG: hypothetical protein KDA77_22730, partial [Planctomycetaceae bacterium]|nr:hypothetical protein [Planctomycetaceae bacterium]
MTQHALDEDLLYKHDFIPEKNEARLSWMAHGSCHNWRTLSIFEARNSLIQRFAVGFFDGEN